MHHDIKKKDHWYLQEQWKNTVYEKKKLSSYSVLLLIECLILPHGQTSMGKQQYPERLATKMVHETVSHEKVTQLKELNMKPGKEETRANARKRGRNFL